MSLCPHNPRRQPRIIAPLNVAQILDGRGLGELEIGVSGEFPHEPPGLPLRMGNSFAVHRQLPPIGPRRPSCVRPVRLVDPTAIVG